VVGYDRSFFFRGAVELLLELAAEAVSLPVLRIALIVGAISAGRSVHSISGRWFWYDWPDTGLGLCPCGGGGGVDFEDGGPDVGGRGRFTMAAVVLVAMGRDAATPFVAGRELLTLAPTSLLTSHAESGRSFK
jgi:hypothetical protein